MRRNLVLSRITFPPASPLKSWAWRDLELWSNEAKFGIAENMFLLAPMISANNFIYDNAFNSCTNIS
jgi:hypothetical protein